VAHQHVFVEPIRQYEVEAANWVQQGQPQRVHEADNDAIKQLGELLSGLDLWPSIEIDEVGLPHKLGIGLIFSNVFTTLSDGLPLEESAFPASVG